MVYATVYTDKTKGQMEPFSCSYLYFTLELIVVARAPQGDIIILSFLASMRLL